MDLGLGERDAHAQDRAMAFGRDADGDQHSTVDDAAAVANLFVAGVEDQVRDLAQRPIAPDFAVPRRAAAAARLTCMLDTSQPQIPR